jgi:ABC-type branched-subunit amino acid transport system substrate-binding protein/serine/threonine protein kinase
MCLNPGDILCDRYQIIAQLGQGGFARTYTANDLEQPENSPCVVKEIRPPQSTVTEVLQRANTQFEIEAAALQRLGQQHPRIPNLIDSFENNGKFYLIQEYIPGQSLRDEFTTGTRWTQEQVIVLLQEILSIIQFVHEQGMVHRDIHPGNLIRRSCDSSIVLIDFGAVREISTLGVTNSGEISTTQAIGIRGYMPAEQLLMPWNPQPYNDIYAIGAIAVQAITHLHPNNLPRDFLSCELLWHYSTPDRELPQISDGLRRILNQMIRFPYCDRYHSAADVLRDLRSVIAVQLPPIQQPAMELESDTNIGNSHLPASLTNIQTVTRTENRSEELYSPTNNQTVPQAENLSEQPYWSTNNQTVTQAENLWEQPSSPTSNQTITQTVAAFFPKLKVRLSIAIALVAAAGAIAIHYNSIFSSKTRLVFGDGLSAGEEILFTSSSPRLKQRGVSEFAASNSTEAFNLFKKSWQEYGKDPETLVYMNNAFLEANKIPYYTISVVIPIGSKNPDSPTHLSDQVKEVLRGVAQAQTEVNLRLSNSRNNNDFPGADFLQGKAINGKGLKVILADDANDKEEAKQKASLLVNQPDILAVIGHSNSEMTIHTVDIYNKNNLVLMSSSSATEELTDEPRKFFFRTQYTSSLIAISLGEHLIAKNQKQAVILYNQANAFGSSFYEEFKKYFESQGGKIIRIRDFDLSKKDFNAQRAIKEIEAQGETAIALVPDAHVTNSLNNAFEIMKLNGDRNWIVGAWTLMCPQTLEIAFQSQQKLFKKFISSVGWHPLSSINQEFPQQARSLWGGEVNTRTASAYDATRALIKALEMQQQPSREGMQKTLSSPNFSADGATGTIQFDSPKNGDRKNPTSDLVHIVKCPKEQFGLTFVPVKYPTAAAAGLKCD